ncbi:vacuolar-processing enzyme-like [Hibiscus syriacus]|uniref:Vacuolar-processing enzyme-like n=1 Tax=Hibiscus syriacus TaxID=106335 RepID=A0A6A3BVE7_HIBSY|nr:vacuolar-processing enzyme-like [Hibiscus syriacus]
MEDSLRSNNNNGIGNSTNYIRDRTAGAGVDGGLLRSSSDPAKQTASSSDFVLQWGNRKRLRCMKIQVKEDQSGPVNRTTVRVDRRVVRADKDSSNQPSNNNHGNGYFNLRQRPASPQAPPLQRVLRNSENSGAMRGQSNGAVRGFASPDRGAHDKRVGAASSDMAHDSRKGGSSSGSGEAAAAAAPPIVWPPKFVIALTNKEKEEDFMAIKGSKLPQRPKKRAKFIQRTLNLVSPGAWLCDLTLDRYEVREKKISKKRPRGLKAMGNINMESDSE